MATFTPQNSLVVSTTPANGLSTADAVDYVFNYLRQLSKSGGPLPSEYLNLNLSLNSLAHLRHTGLISQKDIEGIRKELGEAMSPKTIQGFAYCKPHGYAGDYEIIEKIYAKHICQEENLRNWDMFFQSHQAAQAVRNRVSFFLDQAWQTRIKNPQGARILNVASGPGRDMYECLQAIGPTGITFDCIDQDVNAIIHAKTLCNTFSNHLQFFHQNVFKFIPKTTYHLIWSAGLFDYFSDNLFKRVLKRLLPCLEENGKLIIGNFSNTNPSQDYMEFFNWLLHHRSPKELQALAEECGVSPKNISIEQEPEGVNLFLTIYKEPSSH